MLRNVVTVHLAHRRLWRLVRSAKDARLKLSSKS
jgi:hypothetical protein